MPEHQPGDRAMFWFNVVGLTLATGLFAAFFWICGPDIFGFLTLFFFQQHDLGH